MTDKTMDNGQADVEESGGLVNRGQQKVEHENGHWSGYVVCSFL